MYKVQKIAVTSVNLVSKELVSILSESLHQDRKVLWLVSGGSSVPVAIDALKRLKTSKNLRVALVDDYRSTAKEAGKNCQELCAADFPMMTILQENTSLEICNKQYEDSLNEALAWADFTIGQFGLGAGYHTGGIQPQSQAAQELNKLTISYVDNGVEHLTITPALIKRLNVAFINSTGEAKRPLVEHFLESNASVYVEPTQVLKEAQETVLCSDVLPKP